MLFGSGLHKVLYESLGTKHDKLETFDLLKVMYELVH